jgi:TonB family protein
VNAVIEVYVTPEGKLMAAPTLVRSSGFKHLDDLAVKEITEAVAKVPLKNPVRYTVLFDLPSAKPAA